jgi:hypothetical protein
MVRPPGNEFVAHTLYSDDQFRLAGVLLEFLTKAVDVHIHSSRKCSAVIARLSATAHHEKQGFRPSQ